MRDWNHLDTRYVDHVIGAFFLVRRQVFLEMGGFDEAFFVYLEDLDFCARVKKLGLRVAYLAHVPIFHEQGGVSRQDIAHRMFHSERSRIVYARKHFGRFRALLLLMLSFAFSLPLRLLAAVFRGSPQDARDTVVAYARLAVDAWSAVDQSRTRE
jgi:GT2 family glycosyltransferase